MTWSYRIMRHKDKSNPSGYCYIVHEVYYNKKGKPYMWTENGADICGDSPRDIAKALKMIARDCQQSVLDFDMKPYPQDK